MPNRHRCFAVLVFCLAIVGCQRAQEWSITVENLGDVPCDVRVDTGDAGPTAKNEGHASQAGLAKGKRQTLLTGSRPTVVKKVTVMRDKIESQLVPSAELSAPKEYRIVVDPEGKLSADFAPK
jgi:hypothetical protein